MEKNMKKLITFLGNSVYESTAYEYNGIQSTKTIYIQRAIDELIFEEEVMKYFILTKEAKSRHDLILPEYFKNYKIVLISPDKDGRYEWAILEAIIDIVDENDEIHIDITHGFRSIPVLAVMAFNYLKSYKPNVVLGKLLYMQKDSHSRLVDMSEMFNMLEWAFAVNEFVRNGDAHQLSELMSKKRATSAERIHDIADDLLKVDESIRLCRSRSIGLNIKNLKEKLENFETNDMISKRMVEHIRNKYIKIDNDMASNYAMGPLYAFENNQLQQAITLAQENYITALMDIVNFEDRLILTENNEHKVREGFKILFINQRSKMSGNEWQRNINKYHDFQKISYSTYQKIYNQLSQYRQYHKVFNELRPYRNDINHGGFSVISRDTGEFYDVQEKLLDLRKFYKQTAHLINDYHEKKDSVLEGDKILEMWNGR